MSQYYCNSDNLLTLSALYDNANAVFVNGASVSATILDQLDNVVWSGDLEYLDGTNGTYQAQISANTVFEANSQYLTQITATVGSNVLYIQDLIPAVYYE